MEIYLKIPYPHNAHTRLAIMTTCENQRTNDPVNAHLRPELYTNKRV